MADQKELLYRPNINAPVRENEISTKAEEIIDKKDIPSTIISAYKDRFKELEEQAIILAERCDFLMDLAIEDIDGYVGGSSMTILQYIHDLTGIDFTDPNYDPTLYGTGASVGNAGTSNNGLLPPTDPIYTLDADTLRCIFRVANYYNSYANNELLDAVQNWDSEAFNKKVMDDVNKMGYLNSVMYGLKLLLIVIKICYVIMVHYTVGYVCAVLKETLRFKFPVGMDIDWGKKAGIKYPKGIDIKWSDTIGDILGNKFGEIENKLLNIAGFACSVDDNFDCGINKFDAVKFKKITCCTKSPFFFNSSENGQPIFSTTTCFQEWIKKELEDDNRTDPNTFICDTANRDNTSLTPTPEESAKAQAITNYLIENPSKTGSIARSDLIALKSAKVAADQGKVMSQNVQSSLDSMNTYNRTEKDGPWYNCFGYEKGDSAAGLGLEQKQNLVGTKQNSIIIETGAYFQEYMALVDDAVMEVLKYADKVVCGTANLSKWASSKQLCCYIYLLVIIASLFHSLIMKGSICEELDSDTDDNEKNIASRMRNELSYAQDIQNSKDVQKFVALLQLMKQIIDIFLRKMERGLFLQGFVLPFGEMFEMIKLTLTNGLSSFLDILFGPLDMILVNLKAVPEFRHMINNQCFGFDKLMDFLSCTLGSLKFGILQEIGNLIDKMRLKDVALLDDIYLSRARFEFLKAISELLKIMIGLIFSIKDCYDSQEILNTIVDKQQAAMTDGVKNLNSLLTGNIGPSNLKTSKERAEYLDNSAISLFGQNFIPDDIRIAELENDKSTLSSTFGDLGMIGDTIIQTDLFCSNCKSTFKVAEFITEDGYIIPPAEFIKKAEEFSDIKLADIQRDMTEIFDILRGK